jgi:ATP-dependent helicase/nuclease subunit A
MRILYVAMTRPERKLLLFGSQKAGSARDVIYKGAFCEDVSIPSWQIYSCNSLLQWILYGLSDSDKLHKLFETGLNPPHDDDRLFSAKLYSEQDFDRLDAYIKEMKNAQKSGEAKSKTKAAADSQMFEQIKQSLRWEYPRLEYSKIDAKSSVTELTHSGDEYFRADLENSLTKKPFVIEYEGASGKPAGKVFGTAVHLLLAEVDLQDKVTESELRVEKDRLVSEGLIPKEVADSINEESLKLFFDTEPGQMVFEAANKVFREWKFTFALPVAQWAQITERDELHHTLHPEKESVIVQGVVDLLIETPDELIVVDFKTDNISPNQTERRSEKYKTQLELYASAARTVMGKKCESKYLYFINPARLIDV